MARKKINSRVRFEVLERDGFACRYCGAAAPDAVLEIDHVEPVARGGTNDPANLVTACQQCNNGKGANLTLDYRALYETHLRRHRRGYRLSDGLNLTDRIALGDWEVHTHEGPDGVSVALVQVAREVLSIRVDHEGVVVYMVSDRPVELTRYGGPNPNSKPCSDTWKSGAR